MYSLASLYRFHVLYARGGVVPNPLSSWCDFETHAASKRTRNSKQRIFLLCFNPTIFFFAIIRKKKNQK